MEGTTVDYIYKIEYTDIRGNKISFDVSLLYGIQEIPGVGTQLLMEKAGPWIVKNSYKEVKEKIDKVYAHNTELNSRLADRKSSK